jgi:hypothetical protein
MNSVKDRMILVFNTSNGLVKSNSGKGVYGNEISIILFESMKMSCDSQDPRNENKQPSSLCHF